jgi:cell division protein FtsI (penicillin-binding protein 3)
MLRPLRTRVVLGAMLLFSVALVVRSATVQLWEGREWQARAQRQHYAVAEMPARRGNIFDVGGVPLAQSREMVSLAVAPRELRNPDAARRALDALGLTRSWVARATDHARAWVELPGLYLPGEIAELAGITGVYPRPAVDRVYTQRDATRRVVGHLGHDGDGVGGIELVLDSLLRGRAGSAVVVRDARGVRFEAVLDTSVAPLPGHDVVLTISQELQEISQRALGDAITRMRATGGDIVMLDPHTGEIRAMASVRQSAASSGSPVLSEPFEPGSTIKPLFLAALFERGLVRLDEMVNTENGKYTIEGRTIRDIHRAPELSLTDVVRHSSNVGIVKLASRLTAREQFETLRDFGFGTPTGVAFPSEARGSLYAPVRWSRQSAASLAMGYEVAVTPLQLAAAYAVFANGGLLIEPALVKEVRAPDGTVRFRHTPRVVRRVIEPSAAAQVRALLTDAVQSGTGAGAGLGRFAVAGKTGTARRTGSGGRYDSGSYTASFVGMFPAEDPQYVILVKLDNPSGEYYGGRTAAPVSRAVLEAAIAARDAALDRRALMRSGRPLGGEREPLPDATPPPLPPQPPTEAGAAPYVFTLSGDAAAAAPALPPRAIPDVSGMELREAARRLHRAGFRVDVRGGGKATETVPAAGSLARPGSLVRVITR